MTSAKAMTERVRRDDVSRLTDAAVAVHARLFQPAEHGRQSASGEGHRERRRQFRSEDPAEGATDVPADLVGTGRGQSHAVHQVCQQSGHRGDERW